MGGRLGFLSAIDNYELRQELHYPNTGVPQ
jgi:hypothetical protein